MKRRVLPRRQEKISFRSCYIKKNKFQWANTGPTLQCQGSSRCHNLYKNRLFNPVSSESIYQETKQNIGLYDDPSPGRALRPFDPAGTFQT